MSAEGREICRVRDRKNGEKRKDWKDDKDPGKVVRQISVRVDQQQPASDGMAGRGYWLDWFDSTSVEDRPESKIKKFSAGMEQR